MKITCFATGIYNGTIRKWNDASIKELNENMPDEEIKVVVRADRSGTTFIVTVRHGCERDGKNVKKSRTNSANSMPTGARNTATLRCPTDGRIT